jgi:hypothetical protein
MVVYAVEAGFHAVHRAGLDQAQRRGLLVAGLSHNGPCIYSEEFYEELVDADAPRLVSPMLFSESVLNIVASHLSLAMSSRSGVYAFHTDLAEFIPFMDTLRRILAASADAHMLFCVSEEFSPLARRLFAECGEYPGNSFVNGALAAVLCREEPVVPAVRLSEVASHVPVTGMDPVIRLAEDGGTVWISAYSEPAGDIPGKPAATLVSPLAGKVFQNEQAFTVMRMAELLLLAQCARPNAPAALLERHGDHWSWIVLERTG